VAPSRLEKELKQSRPFEHLETAVVLNLARTHEALRGPQEALMKDNGLSAATYNVLRILRGAGKKGLPCREIGERMVTRVPDVTRLLDRLTAAGLVARARDSADRRVVTNRITPEGLKLLSAMDQPLVDLQQQQLRHMSPDELETLSELLEKARAGALSQE
jgi:DNA-binding MarR family transcriptional regulator